jgi:hypothetical protein
MAFRSPITRLGSSAKNVRAAPFMGPGGFDDPSGAASDYYRGSGQRLSQISGRGFSFALDRGGVATIRQGNSVR